MAFSWGSWDRSMISWPSSCQASTHRGSWSWYSQLSHCLADAFSSDFGFVVSFCPAPDSRSRSWIIHHQLIQSTCYRDGMTLKVLLENLLLVYPAILLIHLNLVCSIIFWLIQGLQFQKCHSRYTCGQLIFTNPNKIFATVI